MPLGFLPEGGGSRAPPSLLGAPGQQHPVLSCCTFKQTKQVQLQRRPLEINQDTLLASGAELSG